MNENEKQEIFFNALNDIHIIWDDVQNGKVLNEKEIATKGDLLDGLFSMGKDLDLNERDLAKAILLPPDRRIDTSALGV